MCALKVVPEIRWHVEAGPIDDRRCQLDITLIERGLPVAGFGGEIGKAALADLVEQLRGVLAEWNGPG